MSDAHVLHIFGGKGGVGKTTLSAAWALRRSEDAPKQKILLLSLDGSHTLSDLFKKKLGPKPVRLTTGKGEGGLYAAELETPELLEGLLAELQPVVEKAAARGALLTEAELQGLFRQALPGLEELAGFLHVLEQVESGGWDVVALDAAPTSHTLRLFDTPAALRRFLAVLKGLPEKGPTKIAAKLTPAAAAAKAAAAPPAAKGKKPAPAPAAPAAPDALEPFAVRADRVLALLKDGARCAFHLVTLAEPVPEAQTRLLFNQLRERGIPVHDIVVNQVEDHEGCPACQGRRGLQAPHVRKYQGLDKAVPVQLLGKRELAPRGPEATLKLGKEWASGKETKALEFSAAEGPPALVRAPSMPPIAAPPLPPTRLIFFVGQGGVGKSSCAAAAAVTLTEKEGPVLLISVDPAHSLSDVLQSRLTDTETQVKGTKGLYARELDIPNWFAGLKKKLRERAEKAFEGPAKPGAEMAQDAALFRNLLDAPPANIDELGALFVLTDALVQERFKRIVVDPAPSTGGVRVVELAHTVKPWLTALHAVALKYKGKGMAELEAELAGMLRHVERFQKALASPTESRFVVVTRGEEMAEARTERFVDQLKEQKLQVERVLVNRVLPKNGCPKCENRRKNELAFAKTMEKKVGVPITVAPALGRHPAGLRELKAFRTAWYALSATTKSSKAA